MNILLLKPHSSYAAYGDMIPLGLGYIASTLREDGHKVKILDFSIFDAEKGREQKYCDDKIQKFDEVKGKWKNIIRIFKKTVKSFHPKAICITCNTSERYNMFRLANELRKITNEIVIVGGPHVTMTAQETLEKIKDIDIIVRSEGEDTIKELCRKIEADENWHDVKGISYVFKGKVVTNPDRELIKNLDKIPFPARDLFENKKYSYYLPIAGTRYNVTGIVTSRGCPGRCHYCSGFVMWHGKFRFRSPESVVNEMEDVLKKYPFYDGFWIFDDHFFANNQRAIDICKEIKRRKLNFVWGCSGRADNMTETLAKEMASAGCLIISFGIESGSDRVLKLMNKQIDTKKVDNAIKICKKNGILPRGTFIFGYPGEKFTDILKTMRMIFRFEPATINYSTNVLCYPGTVVTHENMPDIDWCAPISEDMPRVQNIPSYIAPDSAISAKTLNRMLRILFLTYTATHPNYAIRILKKRLGIKNSFG